MPRPRKVEEQNALADQLLEEAYGKNEPIEEEDGGSTIEVEGTIEDVVFDGNPNPTDDHVEEGSAVQVGSDDYKQKYMSLQGMYNAEIPRMQQQIKYLQDLLADTVTSQQRTESTGPAPIAVNQESISELKTEYPDVFEAVSGMIAQAEDKILRSISNVMSPVIGQVQETSSTLQKTAKESFENQLRERVHDVDVINNSPDFIEWLQEKAPYTKYTRHQLLVDAFNSREVELTAKFFSDFKKEKGITDKQKPNRESQIGLPRSNAGRQGVTTKSTDKQITTQMIAVFYKDCREGKYRGREDQMKAVEAEINKAMRENRIVRNT